VDRRKIPSDWRKKLASLRTRVASALSSSLPRNSDPWLQSLTAESKFCGMNEWGLFVFFVSVSFFHVYLVYSGIFIVIATQVSTAWLLLIVDTPQFLLWSHLKEGECGFWFDHCLGGGSRYWLLRSSENQRFAIASQPRSSQSLWSTFWISCKLHCLWAE
jgi:hypothetical protein